MSKPTSVFLTAQLILNTPYHTNFTLLLFSKNNLRLCPVSALLARSTFEKGVLKQTVLKTTPL